MNILVSFIIILLLMTSLNGGNDLSIFRSVESNLSKYRQKIDRDEFSFENGTIYLALNGRRTNIKSQLLLGFYTIGKVLNKVEIDCREVEVEVYFNIRGGDQVIARVSADKVLELSQGRLRSDQFFMLIGFD